jgi:outer membrane biosynthesis protein TonB
MPQTAVATQTSINHTAVKGVDPKPAPKIDILSARMNEAVSRLPADTLANLEKSMTSSSGGLLSPDNPFLASQSVIAPQSSTVPAAPNAIPGGSPPASPAGQGRAANKYITLSFNDDTYQGVRAKPMLNLLDIAKLNEATRSGNLIATGSLDAVEKALQQALLREWEPPLISAVPHSQRRVTVNLVIMRDGSVKDAVIQKPSGSDVLDASVRAALGRVTKIAESLPSSFPKERYPLRVNLLIE